MRQDAEARHRLHHPRLHHGPLQMDELQQLQAWYASQCDGEWEHEFGITIENVDNPGWSVSISLAGTELESARYETVSDMTPPTEWLHCRTAESADGRRWKDRVAH